MSIAIIVVLFMLIISGVLLSISSGIFSGISVIKKQLDRSWNTLDHNFKQRNELIPHLIAVVDKFSKSEKTLLHKLKEAHEKYSRASQLSDKIKVQNEITNSLKAIEAIGEAYVELRSCNEFIEIQNKIKDLAKQSCHRIELFNETIKILNVRLEQFPDMLLGALMGCSDLAYLKVDDVDQSQSIEVQSAA